MSRSMLLMIVFELCMIIAAINMGYASNVFARNTLGLSSRVSTLHVYSGIDTLIDGDINITESETLTLQDGEYNLTARIVAEENATIVIRNANVTLAPKDNDGISMLLNGNSRLLVNNSTINFVRLVYGDCQIMLQNESEADFTKATVTGWGFAVCLNASSVYVLESTIGDGTLDLHSPGIASYDTSRLKVENSTVEGVYVWDSSTCSINDSVVGIVRTGVSAQGSISINISDSQVGTIETFSSDFPPAAGEIVIDVLDCKITGSVYAHDNSTVKLERSSIGMVRATGNATVWLIESSASEVSSEGSAEVLLGFHLPLFGLIGLPYSLKPLMQAAPVMVILAGVGAVSYGIFQKKRAKEIHS